MFTYTVTITRNGKLVAVFHPKTRAEALDTLRSAEDYAAQQWQCDDKYTVTLTAVEK